MVKDRDVDERLCGKFKSIEDLENAYSDLEKKFGGHGRQIGALKKRCAHLEDELNKLKLEKGEERNEGAGKRNFTESIRQS